MRRLLNSMVGRDAPSTIVSPVFLSKISSHLRRQRYVALKVCAADADSQHELNIFSHLFHDDSRNVLRLLDSFSLQGPNGLHTILVHDVLGQPTTVMRSPALSGHRVLCHQLAQGLAALHRHDIVHGGK
jgi:serine/threonine-protein kinase SRPK3